MWCLPLGLLRQKGATPTRELVGAQNQDRGATGAEQEPTQLPLVEPEDPGDSAVAATHRLGSLPAPVVALSASVPCLGAQVKGAREWPVSTPAPVSAGAPALPPPAGPGRGPQGPPEGAELPGGCVAPSSQRTGLPAAAPPSLGFHLPLSSAGSLRPPPPRPPACPALPGCPTGLGPGTLSSAGLPPPQRHRGTEWHAVPILPSAGKSSN